MAEYFFFNVRVDEIKFEICDIPPYSATTIVEETNCIPPVY